VALDPWRWLVVDPGSGCRRLDRRRDRRPAAATLGGAVALLGGLAVIVGAAIGFPTEE